MIRKRSLSLLEVVIALVLTSLLLSVLFQGYRQLPLAQKKAQVITSEVLSLGRAEQYLSSLFSRINDNAEKLTIHTDMISESRFPALFLILPGDIDPDPDFSGAIHGILFLSLDHELCFDSLGENDKHRTDLLLTGLSALSFLFFDPESQTWVQNWPSSKTAPPPLCEITLSLKDKKEQTFAYSLPIPLEFFSPVHTLLVRGDHLVL